MPKQIPWLKGVESFKLRSLLTYLNGIFPVHSLRWKGGPRGLNFELTLLEPLTEKQRSTFKNDVLWAAQQAGWENSGNGGTHLRIFADCSVHGMTAITFGYQITFDPDIAFISAEVV